MNKTDKAYLLSVLRYLLSIQGIETTRHAEARRKAKLLIRKLGNEKVHTKNNLAVQQCGRDADAAR